MVLEKEQVTISRYTKGNNKCIKDYDKIKKSLYLQYWDVNDLYGWAMSQNYPVNNFKYIKNTYQLNEDKLKWGKWWRIFLWSWCLIVDA